MPYVKNIILLTLRVTVGLFVYAQEEDAGERKGRSIEPVYDSISDRVLLRREFAGGILLHSRGWGFHFRKGRNLTYFRSLNWEVDVVSMKSPKQIKTINPYFNNANF